jgi:hypothetical protein
MSLSEAQQLVTPSAAAAKAGGAMPYDTLLTSPQLTRQPEGSPGSMGQTEKWLIFGVQTFVPAFPSIGHHLRNLPFAADDMMLSAHIQSEAPSFGGTKPAESPLVLQPPPLGDKAEGAVAVARLLSGAGATLPALSMIRGMLDRDELPAARALLAVAANHFPATHDLSRVARILARPRSVKRSIRDRDRRREYAWLTRNAAAHRGKWVGIVGDRLVASAESLQALLAILRELGQETNALVYHIT